MMPGRILFLTLFFFVSINVFPQLKAVSWDNTQNKYWPENFYSVHIKSSIDYKDQNAVVYKTTRSTPQPLIISLHTWSGNYLQEDPLAQEVIIRDWNYIHPDFRGPNNQPDACGSRLVISDLEDVINFSRDNLNIDTNNIHIIGVSGGAFAALMMYMISEVKVNSINAWVPISDLKSWYWETIGRKSNYSEDIKKIALKNGKLDMCVLEMRSPLNLKLKRNKNVMPKLNIYAGIHDGYTGSVPISHSILFFNKIVSELYPDSIQYLISESELQNLLIKQYNPELDSTMKLFDRIIHSKKQIDKLSITIFEGSHEMLVEPALTLLPVDETKYLGKLNILTIGDSNGSFSYGWPAQLKKLMPFSTVINHSIAGNTIGFDNNENPELNTYKNINRYLEETISALPNHQDIDIILIGLGTNDGKNIFKNDQALVIQKLDLLIDKIDSFFNTNNLKTPLIYIISPPPIDESKINTDKYSGSQKIINRFRQSFRKVAMENKIEYIDVYTKLISNFDVLTSDGIHLNNQGQFEYAQGIIEHLLLKSGK